jgi:hypothetical protein
MFIRKNMLLTIALLVAAVAATALGCGSSDSNEDVFIQVRDPGHVFSMADLIATPYKEVSNYSTEGLPGATDVSFGFMKVSGGDPYDYEVRFYVSHEVAVDEGTTMAIEGTGPDAILSDDDAAYKEGIKNRRTIIGGGVGGGARSGIGPKFGSYAIFGNIVMLCQGPDVETSQQRCGLLQRELLPSA